MKLLLGSYNPSKVGEFNAYLIHAKIKLFTLSEFGGIEEPLEIGNTFLEVALQKARYYAEKTEYPTLADDGGFEVDALEGQPGIYSKRWVGPSGTDSDRIDKVLRLLKGCREKDRTARLRLCIVVYFPSEREYISVDRMIEGIVPLQASSRRVPGLPYRSILYLPQYGKCYSELTLEEQEEANHRRSACRELLLKLEPWLD